jgi:hypothetical protein
MAVIQPPSGFKRDCTFHGASSGRRPIEKNTLLPRETYRSSFDWLRMSGMSLSRLLGGYKVFVIQHILQHIVLKN